MSAIECETLRVKYKNNGQEMIINKDDFDETKHALLRVKLEKKVEKQEEPQVENSAFSKQELSTMTLEALQSLPEFSRIPEGSSVGTKELLVKEILKARK